MQIKLKAKPQRNQKGSVHNIEEHLSTDELGLYSIYATSKCTGKKNFQTKVKVNNQYITMCIDTAADCTVMSRNTYESKFGDVAHTARHTVEKC